jgi:hypothetical protein
VSLSDVTLESEPIPLAERRSRARSEPARPAAPAPASTSVDPHEVSLDQTGSDDVALPFLDPEPSTDTPRESLASLLGDELDSDEPEPITEASPRPAPRAAAPASPPPSAPAASRAPEPKPVPEAKPADGEEDEFLLDALFDEIQGKR